MSRYTTRSNRQDESVAQIILEATLAVVVVTIILNVGGPAKAGLYVFIFFWQMLLMYVIGRKRYSVSNIAIIDLPVGVVSLCLFFKAPIMFLLMPAVVYLIAGKESKKV